MLNRAMRPFVAALIASLLIIPGAGSTVAGSRQIALGVSVLDDRSVAVLDAETAAIGRKPALWSVWSDWGGPDREFPTAFMNVLKERDITPIVFWQPVDPTFQTDCAHWSLDSTLRGDHDEYIRQWARDAKAYGGTVILRFAHEMNGNWFIWGRQFCTNTASKFRAVWRHVWNIFKGPDGVGATNVKFMWSPFGRKRLSKYYPGSSYVDYAGITVFNWGPPKRPWGSMLDNFRRPMNAISRVTRKPVIAAETGAAYVPDCGACDKAQWIRQGYPQVYKKYKRLKGIVYFDVNMWPVARQPDWRLNSPEGALQAYRDIVTDSRFHGEIN